MSSLDEIVVGPVKTFDQFAYAQEALYPACKKVNIGI